MVKCFMNTCMKLTLWHDDNVTNMKTVMVQLTKLLNGDRIYVPILSSSIRLEQIFKIFMYQ